MNMKDKILNHRLSMIKCDNFKQLSEWLAKSLEMNDLCWPRYESETQTLGDDSTGGTNGELMAQIIRKTGMLTIESQEGLIETSTVAPAYVDFMATRNAELRDLIEIPMFGRAQQRAMVELFGPIKSMETIVKRLGKLWDQAIKGSIYKADGSIYIIRENGVLEPHETGRLIERTWADLYSSETGQLLAMSQSTYDLENSDIRQNVIKIPARGITPTHPDDFISGMANRPYLPTEPCGVASKKLLDHLEAQKNNMCTMVLMDICPGQIMPGGFCVWALINM